MRNISAIVSLTALLFGLAAGSARAEFQGPFCLQVGEPLASRLVLRIDFVTPSQFQIVGHVFGEEPLFGSGLTSANIVRFAVASGPRGGPTIAPPLSLMGIFSLDNPQNGVAYCSGGTQCPTPSAPNLSLVEPCVE